MNAVQDPHGVFLRRTTGLVLTVAGCLALVAALAVLVVPRQVYAGMRCGSPLAPDTQQVGPDVLDYEYQNYTARVECAQVVGAARWTAVVLVLVAVAALVVGVMLLRRYPRYVPRAHRLASRHHVEVLPQGIAAELARLGELRSRGLLTEAEFAAAKAQLLRP